MTPQEQNLLKGLTDRVNQTQLTDKDPEAEQFIFQNLGRNSDSLYILAQTVLVQNFALDQAKQQLDQAKQQLDQAKQQLAQLQQQAQQQPARHTSFLGSLLGTDQPAPPPPPPPYAPVQTYAPPAYAPPVAYGATQYAPQQGGFLRSAMQTATGVAAGALAFEGIESLLHGFGGGGGYGMGGFSGGRPEEIINNNYYGDSGHDGGHELPHEANLSPDIEDRRDDPQSFADTSNDDSADDSSNFADDSSFDDSSSSDDSSF